MAADLTAFTYFLPIFAFLVVFVIVFAVLEKLELAGKNRFIQLFLSFVIATIFVTASSARQIVLHVIPWFAVLIIALFLLLALVSFMGDPAKGFLGKPVMWVFAILLIIIFLVAGIKVFAASIGPYLPTTTYAEVQDADPTLVRFFSWLYSPRVAGFFLLVIVAAAVSWILVKTGAAPVKK